VPVSAVDGDEAGCSGVAADLAAASGEGDEAGAGAAADGGQLHRLAGRVEDGAEGGRRPGGERGQRQRPRMAASSGE
jgi:hypothetical protein